ncbi:thiaminase II [Citreicella sp. C3M06]|uniref:thiaminase II n=1 Tax=Citreicella sp. C3M06 TaxID=2841564 RepID=UPI001C09864F|nr:thiaminase II [Citreicella sp. C3M06]MBU2960363.1 thiaminase II [Citreicella sp. C3M06]
MSFTQDLAAATATLRKQIHDMPFNRALADGSLPKDAFQGYIVQDAHYLEGFARALALTAAKAPDPDAVAQLSGSAAGAIAVERQLHAHYMGLFGVSAERFTATEVSAACDHYVAFLLRTAALADFAESVAALLPCFWIYRDVGHEIARISPEGNPFAAWIDTYSGEAFDEAVSRMLALVDRSADASDAATRVRMHRAFAKGCWHEWRFWDSAWHQQGWPAPA